MKKGQILLAAMAVILAMTSVRALADESIQSKYGVKIYGKVKLDLSRDDSRVNPAPGNYAQTVQSEVAGNPVDDAQFNMTAAETRLGLKFTGPAVEGMKTSGLVEVDFYDTTWAENKNRIYMRHAYVEVVWPENDFSLLAGQTGDVIFPLSPATLNVSVMRQQGNIDYRRPQLRATQGFAIDEDTKLLLQLALARTIGTADTTAPGTITDTGANSEMPSIQARLALSMPLLIEKKPATLGISGHTGKETHDLSADGKSTQDYNSNSVGLDLNLPITDQILLKSEYWMGKNLAAYNGAIGQGINTALNKSIRASGGWLACTFGPYEKWSFNLGAGMDTPKAADLNTGNAKKNQVIFGNTIYALNEAVQLGLEISQLETTYKDVTPKADDLRIQGSMIYNF